MKAPMGLILALGGKKKPSPEEPSSGGGEGGEAAANELLDAIAAKDAAGVWEALKAAYDICDSGEE